MPLATKLWADTVPYHCVAVMIICGQTLMSLLVSVSPERGGGIAMGRLRARTSTDLEERSSDKVGRMSVIEKKVDLILARFGNKEEQSRNDKERSARRTSTRWRTATVMENDPDDSPGLELRAAPFLLGSCRPMYLQAATTVHIGHQRTVI